MIKKYNALDEIEFILKMPQFGQNDLSFIHLNILKNSYVKETGLKPSFSQVKEYFSWMKIGFSYALSKWGVKSIPDRLEFHGKPLPRDTDPNFFCYCVNGFLRISFLNIAFYATERMNYFPRNYYLPNKIISRKNVIILAAVESGFYCYKHKVSLEDFNKLLKDEDGAVKELSSIMISAMSDLKIPLYDCITEDSFQ